MAWTNGLSLIVLLGILTNIKAQNAQVTCIFAGRCILPCHIRTDSSDQLIHWYHNKNKDSPVHSYYDNTDKLEFQDKKYEGRTSLFNSLVASGNASLLLTGVQVQDEGTYKCYTSTLKGNDEKYVDVKVVAPVESVDITVVDDTLTCSSAGIYPAPSLDWSTVPDSDVKPEKPPDTQTDAQGLYSISSTVKSSNYTFVCQITAGASIQRASLRQQRLIAEGETLTIPCSVPGGNPKDFNLTWIFNNDTVLTFDSHRLTPQYGQWENHVKYTPPQTSIELHSLNSDDMGGKYSCEVITPDLKHLELTSVTVNITTGITGGSKQRKHLWWIAVVVIIAVIATAVGIFIRRRQRNYTEATQDDNTNDSPNATTENGGPGIEHDETSTV
ncbi:hypothetical protein ACEWY4_019181 [Coilia grayii]|uniref:Ig-like domain-containing protein n=1 Tax=Coilia grayii TaxID=363190 RepID=A0ABD1JGJ8_9TELE